MKFSLAYFGPEALFHVRRDFMLAVKYGLESLGHDVVLSGLELDTTRFNLVVGGYFLQAEALKNLATSGVRFAHINTEVMANDLLNFNPKKVDFLGAYLPSLRAGPFVWDVIMNNMEEHARHGTNGHFLRWGWDPRMEDIQHRAEKDLDFYFFGLMSPRRQQVIQELRNEKLFGIADNFSPYFLRNDRIARSKVVLNIIQDEKYSHVGSFRVCYLHNNRSAQVSEREIDPAGYLTGARVVTREEMPKVVAELARGGGWKRLGEEAYENFRKTPMKDCMERLLDASFGTSQRAAGAAA